MPPPPLRADDRSDWQLAPRRAWEAGQGDIVRCFDTAEAAIAFLAQTRCGSGAARQRRRRQRVKRHQVVVPIVIDEPILDTLIALRWLDQRQAESRAAIGDAIGRMLMDLAQA